MTKSYPLNTKTHRLPNLIANILLMLTVQRTFLEQNECIVANISPTIVCKEPVYDESV